MEAGRHVKEEGKDNNLIELIKKEKLFAAVHGRLNEILDAKKFIGRAPSQVVEFIDSEVKPILKENAAVLGQKGDVKV